MINYLFSGCNRAECHLHCNLLYVCRKRDLKEREGLFSLSLSLCCCLQIQRVYLEFSCCDLEQMLLTGESLILEGRGSNFKLKVGGKDVYGVVNARLL